MIPTVRSFASGRSTAAKRTPLSRSVSRKAAFRQLDLFADRSSAATMRANQLRLWFASMAYVLVAALRRIGLAGTELATVTCGSIRLKLLKFGALDTHSVRRIRVAMASSCPDAAAFRLAHARLCR
jgi:hypothetical protein